MAESPSPRQIRREGAGVISGNRRYGFEIKRTDAPRVTASMQAAIEALRLNRLDVVHAGTRSYALGKAVRAVAASDLLEEIKPLRRD